MPMEPIEIAPPVKGMWSFMNPPGHHPDAKDFVAVDDKGKPYGLLSLLTHVLYKLNAENIYAWEQQVYAPFDGVVVLEQDSSKDRKTLNLIKDLTTALWLAPKHNSDNLDYFLGNYVIVQSDDGIYALFAHLRENSIVVKEGKRLKTGDLIAKVGNSGNSIQPHLHFHLMAENNPNSAIPVPFVFTTYEKLEYKRWKRAKSSLPGNRNIFRVA